MKGRRHGSFRAATMAALGLVAAGCARLFTYPPVELENSSAACSDGIDNDLDGKTDCDSPDCDGFCPEEDLRDCNDGRDNDGDGLADAADPRCWALRPPHAQHCAQSSGVELIANFDMGLEWIEGEFGSEWNDNGLFGPKGNPDGRIVGEGRRATNRRDGLITFANNTTGASTLDANLGSLVRQWAFSGSWSGFALSFAASVPPGAMLRAGIAPVEVAPPMDPPLPGAESALFSVTIDAANAPTTFAVDVEGAHFSAPLPVGQRTLCAGLSPCGQDFSKVRVDLDDQGFRAVLTLPSGKDIELRAPAPSSLSLARSRLVLWGGSLPTMTQAALLDDVHLRIAGDRPCDFAVPQIPETTCDFADVSRAFGHQLSLARANDGEYCALVTASSNAGVDHAETSTAWGSTDGAMWSPASSPKTPAFDLPSGAALVGAGIAHDSQGWHAAVSYRFESNVWLAFADSASCGGWGPLTPGRALFLDAEAPSYVIVDGRHDVYFTRPPAEETLRTLWRTSRDGVAPELLAELPTNVVNPVSVQLVGARDMVLVHPSAPNFGLGVGMMLGEADGRSWKRVDPSPLLALDKNPENRSEAVLSFDDEGVSSAALSWSVDGGFLLYGGLAAFGWRSLSGETPQLSVGTARIARADQTFPEPKPTRWASCGNGTCDARETCASCPSDCPCGGVELLADAFTQDRPWRTLSGESFPAAVQYVDLDHAALNWTGASTSAWSVLPLDRAITGDFELSYDYLRAWKDPAGGEFGCSTYVGLGTAANFMGTRSPVQSGIFARANWSHCLGKYATTPSVMNGQLAWDAGETAEASCLSDKYLTTAMRHRVVLRRVGNRVSVSFPRADGCGMFEESITYSGAVPAASAVLIGFGGDHFADCFASSGEGVISNLRLRLLDDPAQCPPDKQVCGGARQQPTCVDTAASPEHCGACNHACGVGTFFCKGGQCVGP